MREFSQKLFIFLFFLAAVFSSSTLLSKQTNSPTTVKDIEGVLEIRLANYIDQTKNRDQKEIIQYILKVNDTFYSLIFKDQAPTNLKTGQRIKVRQGIFNFANGNNELLVSSKDIVIVKDLGLKAIPDAFGKQTTIVMLVNFQDNPNNKPWAVSDVKNTVLTTVNNMFYEFSYQQANVVGDVVGWYTLPINSTTDCNTLTNSVASLAQNAAQKAGVDLSQYNRYVYIFPFNNNCSWAGLGSVGGKPSNAWINGFNMAEVIGHELGHNLGLYHAHSLECNGTSNTGTCNRVEYGDLADTMGYSYTYIGPHFNAFQKERLGWLNFSSSPPVQTVTTSGTYTIDATETNNKNVKALKVLKRKNSTSNDYYYIELRQGIGFDQYLGSCTDCNYTKGVLIHQANDTDPNSSESLDMSPLDGNKNKLVTLTPGNTFNDPNAPNGGVTIKTESVSSTGAQVTITFGSTPPPPDCQHAAPILQVDPGYLVVKPGETARYNFRVINEDNSACAASTFNFTVNKINDQIPVTWTPASASIAPHSSQLVTVTAVTSTNTSPGFYLVRTDAVNAAQPSYSGFTNASLDVRN